MELKNVGFTLKIENNTRHFDDKILSLPIFVLIVIGCGLSMAGLNHLWWIGLIGAGCCAGLHMLGRRWSLAAAALAAVSLIWLLPGLAAFANALFARSMAVQRYEYDLFVNADIELMVAALIGGAVIIGSLCRYRIAAPVLTAVLAGACAYFGISPEWYWIAALVVSLAWVCCESHRLAVLTLCVAVLAVGMLALPMRYEGVKLSENILRDQLAANTVHYAQPDETIAPEEATSPTLPEQLDVREEQELGDAAEQFNPLWLLIAITALVLFVPAVLSDLLKKRIAKNRACFAERDNRRAVCGMFGYGIRMLDFLRISPGNLPYGALSDSVAEQLPELGGYDEMAELWREAAFSSHRISDEQRLDMEAFVSRLTELVWQKCPKTVRIRIKYRHALWGGRVWK